MGDRRSVVYDIDINLRMVVYAEELREEDEDSWIMIPH